MKPLLQQLDETNARLERIEVFLGISDKQIAKEPTIKMVSNVRSAPFTSVKHSDIIMYILEDGAIKSVGTITKEANRLLGKKQKKQSIHARCSKLFRSNMINRVGVGLYQLKVA